jgi:hypothetical protein
MALTIFTLILFILLTGCAARYQVLDVIDLSPPRQVQAERHGGQITVRWRAGAERQAKEFSGYLLYVARYSLVTTPAQELPSPVVLPDTSTTYFFLSTDSAKLFIHLRSRAGARKISLPSLPEVIVLP